MSGTLVFAASLVFALLLLCTVKPDKRVDDIDAVDMDVLGATYVGEDTDAIDEVGIELCRLVVPAANAVEKLVGRLVDAVGAAAVNNAMKSSGAAAEKMGRVEATGCSRA